NFADLSTGHSSHHRIIASHRVILLSFSVLSVLFDLVPSGERCNHGAFQAHHWRKAMKFIISVVGRLGRNGRPWAALAVLLLLMIVRGGFAAGLPPASGP